MTETPPARSARLVLVTADGAVVGITPPVTPVTPWWWQNVDTIVAATREQLGLDVTLLRLLTAERDTGIVTYLAEVAHPAAAEPWSGALDEQPLRLPYARPGGPAADLRWAEAALSELGIAVTEPARQVRTWNLSSIWRLPTSAGLVWLKHVPLFFAHEGAMLARLAGGPVPRLLAHDGGRILLADIPGEDLYGASLDARMEMIDLLVGLQCANRDVDALLALGLPDWRAQPLTRLIAEVVARTRDSLPKWTLPLLDTFVAGLPRRFAEITTCGLPDTFVHGDFHPGNLRGDGQSMVLLDWGDSGVGHPLLDQAAFLAWASREEAPTLRQHWDGLWAAAYPGSDPVRAFELLAPVASARQAVIYRHFLDHIEPAERHYHGGEPALWLTRTAEMLRGPDA